MKKQAILIAGAILSAMILGCENSVPIFDGTGDEITLAEDEVFILKSAESTDRDINAARFGANMFTGGMVVGGPHQFFGMHFPSCATVTVNGEDFPKEIIIDYGDGCTGRAGLEKRGVITLHMTDTITSPGATYTITFEDVSIGNRHLEKTATITNAGLNSEDQWVITSQWVLTSTRESGGETVVVIREYSETKVWISGFETPEIQDDIFTKSGGGTIMVNDELTYERTITDDLLLNRQCMFPLSGVIEITRKGEAMSIDFGEGECDNIAVVTKDGESEEIELISGRFKKEFHRKEKHMKKHNGWW